MTKPDDKHGDFIDFVINNLTASSVLHKDTAKIMRDMYEEDKKWIGSGVMTSSLAAAIDVARQQLKKP